MDHSIVRYGDSHNTNQQPPSEAYDVRNAEDGARNPRHGGSVELDVFDCLATLEGRSIGNGMSFPKEHHQRFARSVLGLISWCWFLSLSLSFFFSLSKHALTQPPFTS